MGQCYFSGSNSGAGFHNYFDGITPSWESLTRYFLIKGGPGVGKSTLMKQVAKKAEEAGEEVERFYCSGDPDSLDGVRLVKRGIVFADATSPHAMDPQFPGAVEEIVSLGDYIKRDTIVKYRSEIEELTKKNKQSYGRAYAFLGAAAVLERQRQKEIASCVDGKLVKRVADELVGGQDFSGVIRERKLFLDAVSCKGRVQFTEALESAKKCYKIIGEGKDVLADLIGREVGYDRKECFYSPLCPDRMWHLLLRNAGIAVTIRDSFSGEEIDSERFFMKDWEKRVEVYEKEARHLEEEAMECLTACKKIHDELEEIYKSNVDFGAVTAHTERLLSLVFSE